MGKVVKLKESQLRTIIENILNEQYITDNSQLQINTWYELDDTATKKKYRVKITEINSNYMVGNCYDTNNKQIGSGREMYFQKGTLFFKLDLPNGGTASIDGPIKPLTTTSNQTTNNTTVTPNSSNISLKTVNDVKNFQDWLDSNKPNWFKNGKLNRGKGYGTLGPYTKKAWEQYKDLYKK